MDIPIESILRSFVSNEMGKLNTCLPAKVVNADDLENGFIAVQPLINHRGYDFESTEYPVVSYVPVIMPATSTCGIVFPVNVGDTVLLVFGQSSFDEFKLGADEPHDAYDFRKFDLSDAIAFVGFNTTQNSVWNNKNHKESYSKDSIKLYNNLGTDSENFIQINKDGSVDVKSPTEINADAPVVNAKDVMIEGVGSVKKFMLSHTHNYTDDGSPMVTATPNL